MRSPPAAAEAAGAAVGAAVVEAVVEAVVVEAAAAEAVAGAAATDTLRRDLDGAQPSDPCAVLSSTLCVHACVHAKNPQGLDSRTPSTLFGIKIVSRALDLSGQWTCLAPSVFV